ncbi:MAG: serine protease [Desulfobacterales bacterium]
MRTKPLCVKLLRINPERIKLGIGSILIITLFWPLSIPISAAPDIDHRYDATVSELEDLIATWLKRRGFSLKSKALPMGRVELETSNHQSKWTILLEPHSALTTKVRLKSNPAAPAAIETIDALQAHIRSYLETPAAKENLVPPSVPEPVLVHGQAVVCIRTDRIDKNIQSSGIVIESHGLILTTAHDLSRGENVILTPQTGPSHSGRVLEIDHTLDLALIHSDFQYALVISIAEGRNLLELGEQVYSLGCPDARGVEAGSGVINGPPRRANGQPLWQVAMTIVPGSSGQPVFDARGIFVAMVKGRYRGVAEVGFLIPLETIIQFLKTTLS